MRPDRAAGAYTPADFLLAVGHRLDCLIGREETAVFIGALLKLVKPSLCRQARPCVNVELVAAGDDRQADAAEP